MSTVTHPTGRAPRIRRTLLFSLLSLLLLTSAASAQKEYDIWFFGQNAGLDFSSGTPRAVFGGMTSTIEGSASICDRKTGALLFYTDGSTIWNRRHQPMPNASDLISDPSSTQAALIVPVPCDPDRYYVFTTDQEGYSGTANRGFHYSIVDMTKQGGLGDVTVKNVELLATASEKCVAVAHANGSDYWVLAHSLSGNTFYAWQITRSGISPTPVTSSLGSSVAEPRTGTWGPGYLKASPDGTRLALCAALTEVSELFDFDKATGKVLSVVDLLRSTLQCYGTSFSPDNSKLYMIAGRDGDPSTGGIYQFDLSSDDPATIIASRTRVAAIDFNAFGAMQIGPDGVLYIAQLGVTHLSSIPRPNQAAPACGFVDNAVSLGTNSSMIGLPNNIDARIPDPDNACNLPRAAFDISSRAICEGTCIELTDRSSGNPEQWSWRMPGSNIGSAVTPAPGTVCYPRAGIYTITLTVKRGTDSSSSSVDITVLAAPRVVATEDRSICLDSSVTLTARMVDPRGPVTYTWSPADGLSCTDCSSPVAHPARTTTYIVRAQVGTDCPAYDTVRVEVHAPPIARASFVPTPSALPGALLSLPVRLDDAMDSLGITRLRFSLAYDSTLMRLRSGGATAAAQLTQGTILEGWSMTEVVDKPGRFSVLLSAPAGKHLSGAGTLLDLRFATFIAMTRASADKPIAPLDFSLAPLDGSCAVIASTGTTVDLSVCGLSYRMMEMTTSKYALLGNSPNPFNPSTRIRFSLGLDGPTRVEVFDAAGIRLETLVDDYLQPGEYELSWDAGTFPSGLYYCRISSGQWSATETMMLAK